MRAEIYVSDVASVFEPPAAVSCQVSLGRAIVERKFLRAQDLTPATVGTLVEEGLRAALEKKPDSRVGLLRAGVCGELLVSPESAIQHTQV